ncbi:MAG: hypothetical protein KatS3mg102_3020 [Planctomycetota bacterium]|nr:MAG: hypothetical protein KatS3mg102_3020 [Planctomycetota bacterium]
MAWWPVGERRGPGRRFGFAVQAHAPDLRRFARDGVDGDHRHAAGRGTRRRCALPRHAGDLLAGAAASWPTSSSSRATTGSAYRFAGRKDVRLLHPIRTMTTLPGRITDPEGRPVGEVLAHFALRRDLLELLGSLRLTPGRAGGAARA